MEPVPLRHRRRSPKTSKLLPTFGHGYGFERKKKKENDKIVSAASMFLIKVCFLVKLLQSRFPIVLTADLVVLEIVGLFFWRR